MLVLIGNSANADTIKGYIEGKRFYHSSLRAYPDLTGDIAKYGIDMELLFPTFIPRLVIMAGVDAMTGQTSFSQVAGRFGANLSIWKLDFKVYHRSNHAIDHTPVIPYKFINDNHFSIRYKFEVGN